MRYLGLFCVLLLTLPVWAGDYEKPAYMLVKAKDKGKEEGMCSLVVKSKNLHQMSEGGGWCNVLVESVEPSAVWVEVYPRLKGGLDAIYMVRFLLPRGVQRKTVKLGREVQFEFSEEPAENRPLSLPVQSGNRFAVSEDAIFHFFEAIKVNDLPSAKACYDFRYGPSLSCCELMNEKLARERWASKEPSNIDVDTQRQESKFSDKFQWIQNVLKTCSWEIVSRSLLGGHDSLHFWLRFTFPDGTSAIDQMTVTNLGYGWHVTHFDPTNTETAWVKWKDRPNQDKVVNRK